MAPLSPVNVTATLTSHIQEKPGQSLENKNAVMRFLIILKTILFSSVVNILLVFVPVGFAVRFAKLPAGVVFGMNAVAIIPLASLLSHATEVVASRLGDTVGALMNVTFGNAVELIIFIIALTKNHIRIVQASLVGSILANLLLILGMCFFVGGLRYREQIYNSTVTQMSACLLSLSVTSLLLPTAFHTSFSNATAADDKVLQVSRGTSVIILLVYLLYLVFQLKSHSYLYDATPQHVIERETAPGPAAQYFGSPADIPASGSDSSDGSSRSERADQRLRRAVSKGKRTEKPIVCGSGTAQGSEAILEASTLKGSAGTRSAQASDLITPVDSTMTAENKLDEEHHCAHRHGKYRHGSKLRRQRGTRDDDNENSRLDPEHGVDATGRTDFAAGPSLEAQSTPTRSRLSFLSFRPSIAQILSSRPTGPRVSTSTPTSPRPGIRRVKSDPVSRGHDLPPVIPLPVDGDPAVVPPSPHTAAGEAVESETLLNNASTSNHHHYHRRGGHHHRHRPQPAPISRGTAIIVLLLSTGLVAACAEFMVSSIDRLVATDPGLSEAFIGLILLPLVGNAAEHVTAVSVALKNKMDLAIGVAVGSSIQIALFVTPLVVMVGWATGRDMGLFFTLFETVCVFVSAFLVNFLVLDGRSNYLEGALLCAAYVIVAVAAFFYPDAKAANSLGGGG